MCFFSIKAKLAAAYLDATTYKLHTMEDVYDNDAFDIAEMGTFHFLGFAVLVRPETGEYEIETVPDLGYGNKCSPAASQTGPHPRQHIRRGRAH